MESCYEEHRKAIGKLAHFYDWQGIKLMVLKGYGLSLNYPKPEHRPVGDVDSYNFGLHAFADQMVHDKLGIEIDNSHHRHSVFSFEGVTIENHYDFIEDYAHRSNKRIEVILKEEVQKGCGIVYPYRFAAKGIWA
nr:nucleotidyltransferase family protein [uncultured Bacteroides sp.]